jgi:hypothetical protein
VSDLPANAAWVAWLVAVLLAGWGVMGLVDKRMTFSIPRQLRLTRSERHRYRRAVTGNLARLFAVGFLGVGALALVSLKAGAIVATVLSVAGWVMGTAQDD